MPQGMTGIASRAGKPLISLEGELGAEKVQMSWRRSLIAVVLLLSACEMPSPDPATTPPPLVFTYKGQSYPTAAAALEAERQDYLASIAGLAKEAEPLKGRVRVVIPDRDRLKPLLQQIAESRKQSYSDATLAFAVEDFRLGLLALTDTLVKTAIFEAITVVEQNDTRNPDITDADYLVWFQVRSASANNTGPWSGEWLIRRAGSEATQLAAIDPGVPAGTARLASFARSVREGSLHLAGVSLAGGGPGKPPSGKAAVLSGTGIIVDTHGHVVTNSHVVPGCTEVRVFDIENNSTPATIISRDAANDLALLKATHSWPVTAQLRDSRDLRPGEDVVVTGYPLNGLLGSEMAVTTGSLTALAGIQNDSRFVQLSAPIQPGNSGGPALDARGNVIGMVTSMLNGVTIAAVTGALPQNVNFAIKASVLRDFLDANRIDYTMATTPHEISTADIGELARRFTVRVECRP